MLDLSKGLSPKSCRKNITANYFPSSKLNSESIAATTECTTKSGPFQNVLTVSKVFPSFHHILFKETALKISENKQTY